MSQDIHEWHSFAGHDWETLLTRDGQPITGLGFRRWVDGAWEYRHATPREHANFCAERRA